MLDKYLVDNLKQHQHCMSPDSKYITLITYATKLEINLCNFLAIWAVLSILLDTKSNDLQYVQCLQQVVNDYYDTHTKEAMTQLEQQAFKILDIIYDSMTKQNFYSISDDVDRVSDAVDRDLDKVDTNKIKPTYDNDSDTNTDGTKYDQNMKGAHEDTDTENNVQNDRHNDTVTQSKWSTETNEVDNRFLRDYDNMRRQMENRQIDEYYKAQRQIYGVMMGDTPVKTVHNTQYIDNISTYDSEVQRISKSVCYKLDLGPISLPGAQQYTTVQAAAAMKTQDNSMKVQDTENALKAHMQNDNGQYKSEIYKRAECIIPQLDGTYNVSDSDTDSPAYLDLANTNIIQYRTRGQKQRKKAAEAEFANRHLANIESIRPNARARKQRQKVPDDEEIDMDKIAKDDMPRHAIKRDLKDILHARKVATEIERQLKENRRLQAEKARQLQMEKDIKEKEAKRRALEKAKIAALIDKHRSCTPNTPDEANKSGTGNNADTSEKKGTEKVQPQYKKATKASQIKSSQNKGTNPNKDVQDALLGDQIANGKKNTKKAKATGQTDSIGINDMGIYEFVFECLLNLPDLEGVDEDRLFELQRNVQEQLRKRDKERERNITKRVQEFEKNI